MATTQEQEDNYTALKALFSERRSLLNVQEFDILFRMLLKRLGVDIENIKSFDFSWRRNSELIGLWLKKPDYAGKIRRKAEAQKRLQQVHEAEREEGERSYHGPPTVSPTSKYWSYSDYVIIDPPLYPPDRWLQECGVR